MRADKKLYVYEQPRVIQQWITIVTQNEKKFDREATICLP